MSWLYRGWGGGWRGVPSVSSPSLITCEAQLVKQNPEKIEYVAKGDTSNRTKVQFFTQAAPCPCGPSSDNNWPGRGQESDRYSLPSLQWFALYYSAVMRWGVRSTRLGSYPSHLNSKYECSDMAGKPLWSISDHLSYLLTDTSHLLAWRQGFYYYSFQFKKILFHLTSAQ